jgi:TolA-binding protein
MGEHQMDKGEPYPALRAYQRAAAYEDFEQRGYALYMMGWCLYNVGDYDAAVDAMRRSIRWSEETEGQGAQLQDEAWRDLVRFCADGKDLDECVEIFEAEGRQDLIGDLMRRLADTYAEQGKTEQAVRLHKRVIAQDPDAITAPESQLAIIELYLQDERRDQVLQEVERYDSMFGADFARDHVVTPGPLKDQDATLRAVTLRAATEWHSEARKLGGGPRARALYEDARVVYVYVLRRWPDSSDTVEVTYLLGELQFATGDFEGAAQSYAAVVALDPAGKRGRFCAEAAVHASRKVWEAQPEAEGWTDADRAYLAALETFYETFPNDAKALETQYALGYLHYEHGELVAAAEWFRATIERDPGSRQAELAANLILDSLVLAEEWVALDETARAFAAQPDLGGPRFKRELAPIVERAAFKRIEAEHPDGGTTAAHQLVAFADEFPESDVADLALYNAAVYWEAASDNAAALTVRVRLDTEHPDSRFGQENLLQVGWLQESSAQFVAAAATYEDAAARFPETAADLLPRAAHIRRSVGDLDQALVDMEGALDAGADRSLELDQMALLVALGRTRAVRQVADDRLGRELSETERLATWTLLIESLADDPKAAAHVRSDALRWLEGHGELVEYGARDLAGELLFQHALVQYQAFQAIAVIGPDERAVRDQAAAKLQALRDVEAAITSVIETGSGASAVAGFVLLGQAFEEMQQSLMDAPNPRGLTDEQMEYYRYNINDRCDVLTMKAEVSYTHALETAWRLSVAGPHADAALEHLRRLDPEQYAQHEALPEGPWLAGAQRTVRYVEVL